LCTIEIKYIIISGVDASAPIEAILFGLMQICIRPPIPAEVAAMRQKTAADAHSYVRAFRDEPNKGCSQTADLATILIPIEPVWNRYLIDK
jgi:hypothetical protein